MAKFKFSDIAYNITDKKIPTLEDKDTYIGLEHMDSGSLTISRFGSEVPLKGQKLVMRKGDILFGRRNAYLKRAAIAPHDGIFSAHGMILRPKTEVVNEKFFPFFIASDYFMDKAIQISVGSLSPTVNWSTLKNIEFNLPDIKKQEKLAELLWAANETKEAYKKLISLTDDLVKSQFIEMFGDPKINPMNWEIRTIGSLTEVMTGATPNRTNPKYYGGNIPWVKTGEISKGIITEAEESITDLAITETNCKLLPIDTIMVAMYGQGKTRGESGILKIVAATNQACAAILPSEGYHPIYLLQYLRVQYESLRAMGRGAQQANLNLSMIKNYKIMYPPMIYQNQFADFVRQSDKSKFELQQTILSLENTIKSIMLQNVG